MQKRQGQCDHFSSKGIDGRLWDGPDSPAANPAMGKGSFRMGKRPSTQKDRLALNPHYHKKSTRD